MNDIRLEKFCSQSCLPNLLQLLGMVKVYPLRLLPYHQGNYIIVLSDSECSASELSVHCCISDLPAFLFVKIGH
jgi:hypothetical protein